MLMLRIAVVLVAITLAACILLWLFTRDRKYLRIAWRVFQFTVFALFVALALLALERVAAMI